MSRRTEDDDARDLLADLNGHGFRICESIRKEYPSYLEGEGATEWSPIDDKRAIGVLAALLLASGDRR